MTQPIAQPEETTNAEVEVMRLGGTNCIPMVSHSRAENQELVLSKSQNGTIGTNLCNPHHKNDYENETANPDPRPLNKRDYENTLITSSSDSNGALALPRTTSTIGTDHSGNSLVNNPAVSSTLQFADRDLIVVNKLLRIKIPSPNNQKEPTWKVVDNQARFLWQNSE